MKRRAGPTAASLVLLAAATLPGQLELRVQLAADPDGRGPGALTWLRTEFAPSAAATWPQGLQPLAACELLLDREGLSVRAVDPSIAAAGSGDVPTEPPYFTARLVLPGLGELTGHCNFDGRESWQGEHLRLGANSVWLPQVELLGLRDEADAVSYDIGALLGNRLQIAPEDPLAPLLTLGAAECGELTLRARVNANAGTLRVVGRSRGGLLLPAILFQLAYERGQSAQTALAAQTERWLLLATAARDGRREEAARQLALSRDRDALDMLERLLLSDDYTRVVAMDALLHRPDAAAHLDRIRRAATSAIADSEELAATAATRLPGAAPDTAAAGRSWLLGLAIASTALLAALTLRLRLRRADLSAPRSSPAAPAPRSP